MPLSDDAVSDQLFSFEKWDSLDEGCYCFYDIVLKVPIGDLPVGAKAKSVTVDFQHGFIVIEVYDEFGTKVLERRELLYSIGESF